MESLELHLQGKSLGLVKKIQQRLSKDVSSALVLHVSDDGVFTLAPSIRQYEHIQPLLALLYRLGVRQNDVQLLGTYSGGVTHITRSLERGVDQSGLNFGADVAEKDSALQQYFVATRSYYALLRNAKHVIVGPKGTGKTALLKKLSSEQDNSIVITPEYYATDLLSALSAAPYATDAAALTITWKVHASGRGLQADS